MSLPATIAWSGDHETGTLQLLDQTLLPHEVVVLDLDTAEGVIDAIVRLAVRGAPAIGVAAAYGLVLGTRRALTAGGTFATAIREQADRLVAARPTAVNLAWAVERCVAAASDLQELLREARLIHSEDEAACAGMGCHGAPLVPEGGTVLTHCNTGRLATAGDGTALAVLFAAWREGRRFRVLADETRPLLQGARLTALELAVEGIPTEVICDGAAAGLMARGEIQLVLTGSDRVAANGDFANKVGTYPLALAAAAHDVPFYVVAPLSTFDASLRSGAEIPIEERDATEVTAIAGHELAPAGIGARNPAFDCTPAHLVTGIVTEAGILRPPFVESIKAALLVGR
ncbi:MAG: S-methyl-5-thioribose-1-phosphate isomerase [bacterium]|nr:S-methyl-5-thioribose-1-phosphate isomerase [bacterium]